MSKVNTPPPDIKNIYKKHKAFTLVETLLTLAIVGLIAALTLSPLIQYIQNQQFKAAYQKATADASNAWIAASYNGLITANTFAGGNEPANYNNFTQFIAQFNTVKQCADPNNSDCWAANETPNTQFTCPFRSQNGYPSRCFIDTSGRAWCNTDIYIDIFVDTNGFAPPNQYGKDRFIFHFGVNGIPAVGLPNTVTPGYTGLPVDYISVDVNLCPNPPCYYKSWLTGAN